MSGVHTCAYTPDCQVIESKRKPDQSLNFDRVVRVKIEVVSVRTPIGFPREGNPVLLELWLIPLSDYLRVSYIPSHAGLIVQRHRISVGALSGVNF